MSGNILNMARQDAKNAISSSGFEEDIVFFTPDQSKVVLLKGLHTKHWFAINSEGNTMNAKQAHINISENDLLNAGFETRGVGGNIALRNYLVFVADSTGVKKKYSIKEVFPSETFGLIVCILGDAKFNFTPESLTFLTSIGWQP